ncbi:MAG: chemotaxis protein CheB, partial [Bacteroidetes bacterium]|nr:chemotaxis protein CheB [Bacteroidota bacterium]
MENSSVVVVGASAGGLQAVAELMTHAPANLNTAFFVVIHASRESTGSILLQHIQKHTAYPCSLAKDKER